MFGVLGGPQKCIGIYGKIVMPLFKLRATPQLYGVWYLIESSVKLETLVNTWNFESGELSIAFSRNELACLVRGVVYAVMVEVKILECHFTTSPTSECIQSKELFGSKCLEWVRKILGLTLAFVRGISL